jgi:hypothetical protein
VRGQIKTRKRAAALYGLWRESRAQSRMASASNAASSHRVLLKTYYGPVDSATSLEPTAANSSPLVGNAADASRGENKKPVAANIVSPNAINEIERGQFGSRKKEHPRITGYV